MVRQVKVPDVIFVKPLQISPLATCGRNEYVTFFFFFAGSRATLHPVTHFTPKRLHTHTSHLDHHYCTHANVSGRNHFVCLACSLYMFCAALPNPPITDAHIHTPLLLSPWVFFFFNHSLLLGLADQDLCRETLTLTLQRYDIGCQCGVSLESFMCSFYLYGQSCFHHLGLNLSRTAHNFPSTANLE